jgi:hypothetical protein
MAADVIAGSPSTTELGRRFAFKIVTQWLDSAEPGTDLVYCDGAGDGGIDIAYLDRLGDREADTETFEGDTWYLVQSKHGRAMAGRHLPYAPIRSRARRPYGAALQ